MKDSTRQAMPAMGALHQDAEAADRELVAGMMAVLEAPSVTIDKVVAKVLQGEGLSRELKRKRRAISGRVASLWTFPLHERARLQGNPDRRVWDVHGDIHHLLGRCAPG
jgi:hypothetical protein